ncbi:sigma-70 family RNA polymerase sigma factor [Luteimonas sp. SX5]|uniref:Sigma-70 family RNA polymerase sigma factor n=1 Tax=Luteimonas galliterrae TaxID=2940486 RepID=A0ABT0MLI6_9GAMM|nr:sigma-70 family RNA polymerase sigma factor [Luteimonas galliterrae]MCL1635747.1 sigma-70 family RNA polymerase sigma factor [Luteimonas galliterrae]
MANSVPRSLEAASLAEYGDDFADQWNNVSLRFRVPLRGFFSKRVKDAAEVDDLTQEVFLHLIRRARGEPIEHVEQYVFQVAANALRDWRRRREVRDQDAHESFDADIHQPATDISPERVLLGREAIEQVTAVLRGLPQRTRDVFVLRVLEQHKYADIAVMMGISVRSAEKHMAKALARLAGVVEQEDRD